ncbi:MAG: PAS domain S-box protein [Bryobacteraceae bacterium]
MIVALLGAALSGAAAVRAVEWLRETRARKTAARWQHWQQLLDTLPLPTGVKDRTGRYVFVNRPMKEWFSARGADILGRRDTDVLPPLVAGWVRESEERLFRGEERLLETECNQEEWLPGSGEGRWLLTKVLLPGTPWGDGVLLVAQEISELHRTQVELARQRDFVQAVLNSSRALIFVLDASGRLARWNRECELVIGYHEAECRGKPLAEALVAPEFRSQVQRMVARLVNGEAVQGETAELVTRSGERRIVDLSGGVVRNENGDPEWLVVTGIDRTAERAGEARRKELAQELEAVWKSSLEALAFVDGAGRIVAANPGFCRLTGMQENEAPGVLLTEVMSEWPGHENAELERFRDRFRSRAVEPVSLKEVRLRDGRRVWLELACSYVARPGKEPWLLISARDITERVRGEQELRAANEFLEATTIWAKELASRAESASAAKTAFLAHVSHELRTPINAILGMLDLTLNTKLEPSQRENLEMVRESAESLLGLVDDLLDVAKAESGRLDCVPAPMRLRETLNRAMRPLIHRGAAKGVQVRWRVAGDVPDAILADSARLRQVIGNLVGNALKYTPQGEVELSVEAIGAGENRRLRFLVSDTGCGVAPAKWAEIFAPFARLASETDSGGGTGLGLTISASLVERMGGWLVVDSEEGQGARFCFTMPLQEAPEGAAGGGSQEAASPSLPQGGRILVAEDNALNQQVIRGLLEQQGFEVTVVPDGESAVREALSGNYGLVLMDVHMPVMDGWAAARAIRAAEPPDRRVPILAMTARDLEEDAAACRAAGMDGYLSKPVRLADLLEAVGAHLGAAGAAAPLPDGRNLSVTESGVRYMDVNGALERLGGDRALLAELAGLFLQEGPRLLAEAEGSLAQGDAPALQNAAHQLKGLLAQFCAAQAREAAWELELEARRADLMAARSRLKALQEQFSLLLPELRQLAGDGGGTA